MSKSKPHWKALWSYKDRTVLHIKDRHGSADYGVCFFIGKAKQYGSSRYRILTNRAGFIRHPIESTVYKDKPESQLYQHYTMLKGDFIAMETCIICHGKELNICSHTKESLIG